MIVEWLPHSLWDLKASKMNMQYNLIGEIMRYGFELSYNSAKAKQNFY